MRLRLTGDALEHTAQILRDPRNVNFEMPYGQSWLCLLLDELLAVADLATEARIAAGNLREETEARVLRYLQEAPFPELPDAPRRFCGTHRSWLFAVWLLSMSCSSLETVGQLRRLLETKCTPMILIEVAQYEPAAHDFLHLPALLALLVPAMDYHVGTGSPPDEPALLSPITAINCHSPGHALVSVWPHAARASVSPTSAERYRRRLHYIFSRKEQWQSDFATVSHWVPQFMWMAMYLEVKYK
jgi:hypothetical protein